MSRRSKQHKRRVFSAKLAWLSSLCSSPTITDRAFRVLYGLIVGHRNDDNDSCHPSDKTLGESCGKSERTVSRITLGLQADGILEKKQTRGASIYTFNGLDTPPPVGGVSEAGYSATFEHKLRHFRPDTPPPVGRAEPSLEPSLEPLADASPLPCNGRASASEKEERGFQGKNVPLSQATSPPAEPPLSKEQRAQMAAMFDNLKRTLGGKR